MARHRDGAQHVEVEFKLAIVGSDPATTLKTVAALDALAGYALGSVQRQMIRDTYWDTRDGTLARRRVSLRTRQVGDMHRFTLKRGDRSTRGLFKRRELEVSADLEGWRAIRAELTSIGVELPDRPPRDAAPEAWPPEAGLVVTQKRTIERTARQVCRGGTAVAELALDTTTYHLGGQQVVYREIEIEELERPPDAEQDVARTIGEALLVGMPDAFERATTGKHGRGLRLARQLGITDPDQ